MSKIDVKAGDLTFGQRIEIGKILTSGAPDIEKFENVFKCMYGYIPKASEYSELIDVFNEIMEGIAFWTEKENTLLKHEPTAKQKRAGIKELSAKIGEFGTVKALAKSYNCDPDIILTWKYGKVFGILYTDLEEYKYNQRYLELK